MGSLKSGIYSTKKIDFLQRRFPKLEDIKWDHRRKLVGVLNDMFLDGGGKMEPVIEGSGLITMVGGGKLSHNVFEGYCTLHSKWLEKMFRPGKFNEYIEKLGCMDVIDDYIYARKGGFGKGYRLTEEWERAFDKLYNSSGTQDNGTTKIVDKKGRKQSPPRNNNAIRSRDAGGNNSKTDGFISFSIPVNQGSLLHAFNEVKMLHDRHRDGGLAIKRAMNKDRLKRIYDEMWDIYYASRSDLTPDGEIPQVYVESQSGRLYGRGLSLQSSIREVKYAALAGMPLKELDISNCHFSIIHQLAAKNSVHCNGIKSYLENKSEYRKELAQDVFGEEIQDELISQEDAIKVIKKCILSSAYGSRTKGFQWNYWDDSDNDYEEPALVADLSVGGEFDGQKKAILLSEHRIYKSIAEDIEKATESILETTKIASSGKGKSYINAMGKAIPVDAKPSKIVAHILQGIEAKMLNIVLESRPGEMVIPMHDGFTVHESVNPGALEEKIKEETGYSVNIHTECNYRSITEEIVMDSITHRAT